MTPAGGEHPVLVATRSAGKLKELRPILETAGFVPLDLTQAGITASAEEAHVERFDTFEENAMAKARYFYEVSGLPTIADDSGLAVDALGGAPGVRSKRWSGRLDLEGQELDDANNARLLAAMSEVAERGARYVCVAAYVDGERELMARGECAGEILRVGRGSNGFGYDPYFLSYDLGVTFGEGGRVEKERVSHRGRALQRLIEHLRGGR